MLKKVPEGCQNIFLKKVQSVRKQASCDVHAGTKKAHADLPEDIFVHDFLLVSKQVKPGFTNYQPRGLAKREVIFFCKN